MMMPFIYMERFSQEIVKRKKVNRLGRVCVYMHMYVCTLYGVGKQRFTVVFHCMENNVIIDK